MRKFAKGKIESVVDDNDRRIAEYLANGWKEVEFKKQEPTANEKLLETSKNDAINSEQDNTEKKSKQKKDVPNKKINDVIKSNQNAVIENNVVDDGLLLKTRRD